MSPEHRFWCKFSELVAPRGVWWNLGSPSGMVVGVVMLLLHGLHLAKAFNGSQGMP